MTYGVGLIEGEGAVFDTLRDALTVAARRGARSVTINTGAVIERSRRLERILRRRGFQQVGQDARGRPIFEKTFDVPATEAAPGTSAPKAVAPATPPGSTTAPRTAPSGSIGGRPTGSKKVVSPRERDPRNIRATELENESAEVLARKGYRVEQLPEGRGGPSGKKNPTS